MIPTLRTPGVRVALLMALGFILAISIASPRAEAVGGLNPALLPNHRAQAAYERLVNPPRSGAQVAAAYAKTQAMPSKTTLPPALSFQPATNTSTSSKLSSALGDLPPTGSWTSVGPSPLDTSQESSANGAVYGPNSGRTTSIVVVPGTSGTTTQILIGTVGGGVWKSVNNGASWSPLTDNLIGPSLSTTTPTPAGWAMPANMIGALTRDAYYGYLYAASGEGNLCGDCGYSTGMFRSANGGSSWTLISGSKFESALGVTPFTFEKLY